MPGGCGVARGRGAGRGRPADLLQARGLRADEAALTGESMPVDKVADLVDAATELAGRRSLLHGGTLVTAGTAEAVVVATGDRTELGRISGLLSSVEPTQTPLTRSTRVDGHQGHRRGGGGAARRGPGARLPARRRRPGRHHAGGGRDPRGVAGDRHDRARRRRAADGGSTRSCGSCPRWRRWAWTSVVCTDKTGTLTRNEMVLRRAWTPRGDEAEFEGVGTPRRTDGDPGR